ncbi:hypothetical protein [Chitinophaga qingshengii]|uniref:Uncharacterized protein n=1 Tax=Chitinophaga qingshengii TaxID=1569794 RepID=A0ABR7TSD0_9BACT|nr:hypothetical protein [Chitinophaga qingshengii]MBC9932502.1 hypothetical protein [Chitinophaga qingshengii]
MKLKTDLLYALKDQLLNWQGLPEQHLEALVQQFEKIPRDEVSTFYTPALTDSELGSALVAIGNQFPDNNKLQINVVSALGNMVWRYQLHPTDEMFTFLTVATANKKANFYVALHMPVFPQYWLWEGKWQYLLSVPNIAPKKKSFTVFHDTVKRVLENHDEMPLAVKQQIIRKLQTRMEEADTPPVLKDEYLATIHALINQ